MDSQSTRIAFVFFLLAFPFALLGQTVEWSNQQKLRTKTNYTRILGENNSGYYLLRSKNTDLSREVMIEKYKSNLALEQSVNLDQPNGSYIEEVLVQDDGLVVIATKRNDSLPKIDILYWKLNSQLVVQSKPKSLVQIDAALFKRNGIVHVRSSNDKQAHCLYYCTEGSEKKSSHLNLVGFDPRMNITYSKNFVVAQSPEDIHPSKITCDNTGNVYVLIGLPNPNANNRRGRKAEDYFLYTYSRTLDKILEYSISDDSTTITAIDLVVNESLQQVSVGALYNEDNSNATEGTFSYTVSMESNVLLAKTYTPFSKAFVNKIIGTMLNEEGKQITNLVIHHLLARTDGGLTFVLEKVYEIRQSYTYYANGFPQTGSRVTYNYDEIILISNNASGKTEFNEFVRKSQSSSNDAGHYSSFFLLNTNDKLSFIYNTNSSEDGDVMITTINPLGLLETHILIKSLSYYVQLMPSESKQVNNSVGLVSTLKDRRFTLMKITY